MIKRSICLLLVLVTLVSALLGCSVSRDRGDFEIICTVFPIYDWVRSCVAGVEGVSVSLIVDSGTDPHSYTASTEDIASIALADMLVYVGGESDTWVRDALKNAAKDPPAELRLLDMMDESDRHDHVHGEICEGEDHDHSAYDEHVWLSLKNAVFLTDKISKALVSALPEHSELISENSKGYIAKLKELDSSAEAELDKLKRKALLFADRFPFGYLADDYSIECYAAFPGCSADSEASFETVVTLTNKLVELELDCVILLDSSDEKLAKTIIDGSKRENVRILRLNSMQSITSEEISSGLSYIDIMEENVAVLKRALGQA